MICEVVEPLQQENLNWGTVQNEEAWGLFLSLIDWLSDSIFIGSFLCAEHYAMFGGF